MSSYVMTSCDTLSAAQRAALAQGQKALPRVLSWIDDCIAQHAPRARPVSERGWQRLAAVFPPDILESTKLVEVVVVPFPPTMRLGLELLGRLDRGSFDGITFRDTILVERTSVDESLVFHELVHVVQWRALGPERFLLAYGLGLVRHGYVLSPLEQMAYDLQDRFERGEDLPDLVEHIEREAEAIWRRASAHFE